MNRKILQVLTLFTLITLSLYGCAFGVSDVKQVNTEQNIISADNPLIYYCGRFDLSDSKKAVFDWPGTYIKAAFEGTSCSIILKDENNYFSVSIDDNEPKTIQMDTSSVYLAASDLADTIHTILIQKRTEAFVGIAEFFGFILDKDKKLVEHNFEKERRIEFIGNSITCGYGVEGLTANENFRPETENAGLSYASVVSRTLNADYRLASYSGRGMVRNYGDSNKTSTEPMPYLYPRTLCGKAEPLWNFANWIPQVVVINLGTNDFSTQPFPDKYVFQDAYHTLIKKVKKQYTDVTIFCISGPMIGEPCTSHVEEVTKQYNSDDKVYFIPVPRNMMTNADWGSDWHPNISGQQKSADIIIPVIKNAMNW